MQLFRTNASVDEKHNWFIVDFIAPAIATLLVSMMLVAMRYPISTMEPAIDVERPREWTRKILVGGKPNHIDTLTAPSVLDVELAIENSTIIQWYDPSRATSIYFCIASSSKSNAASMPERRPLAIFGRYVQILPGADITAVQEALGFFLGPYFPHNAWLLCRSAFCIK